LRPQGEILVIGSGGGRDILTGLLFKQTRLTAVEVNGNIMKTLNQTFADFSGHLDRDPRIHFVVDEGRHFVESSSETYDMIQASLVDSAAATAAGAYSFVENGLYTEEAWALFLRRLKPHGVLTFSRWYFGVSERPVEIYRTLALAAVSLKKLGIQDPTHHILLVRGMAYAESHERLATILVSPDPFSVEDLRKLAEVCRANFFEVAFSSEKSIDPFFAEIIRNPEGPQIREFPYDITAPTDDRPFFFFQHKIRHHWNHFWKTDLGFSSFNTPAISALIILILLTSVLCAFLIFAPVAWLQYRKRWKTNGKGPSWIFPSYFALIGLAFMFVEIAWMQRLGLYLGHPTYGFTVSLAGILVFSGLGSWMCEKEIFHKARVYALPLLAGALILINLASVALLKNYVGDSPVERIILALALTAPAAFLMGMAFPLGMHAVQKSGDSRSSWYWACNGATSVLGAVLAMTFSFSEGIQATLFLGIGLYACAAGLYAAMRLPLSTH
jgi:hypothetical protein